MRIHRSAGVALLSSFICGIAPAAGAQELAGSFDQLRVLVKPGDRITVAEPDGRVTTGRISDVSASSLALLVDGSRREFREPDVDTIRRRGDDTGAGMVILVTSVYGGLGAAIGVGVDALIRSERVIYARRAAAGRAVKIAPFVAAGRKGAAVSVGF
jgi:hypothetical protein